MTSPETGKGARIARLWQVTAGDPFLKQTSTFKDNLATFTSFLRAAGATFGITVEETDNPIVNGPDFRASPISLADPTGKQSQKIEIIVLDTVSIAKDALEKAAPPIPLHLSYMIGTEQVTVVSDEYFPGVN